MPPDEYGSRLDLMADGLSFPTSLTFAAAGTAYVAEVGLSFGGAQPGGHIQQLEASGSVQLLAPRREYFPTDHAVDRLGFFGSS